MNLPPAPKTKSRRWPWVLGMVASLLVGIGIGAAATSETTEMRADTPVAQPSPSTLPPAEGAEPEPTPAPEPSPVTSEVGTSLDNPIPVGDAAQVGEWTVRVVGYTPNATEAVQRANQFNEKPGAGEQYVLVTLKTTFEGTGSADPWADQTWSVVSADGTLQEEAGQVWPDDLSNVGKVPSGISGIGNVGFMVKSSDVPGLMLYIEADTADFETEGAFLALS
jgi:hypothetical protein